MATTGRSRKLGEPVASGDFFYPYLDAKGHFPEPRPAMRMPTPPPFQIAPPHGNLGFPGGPATPVDLPTISGAAAPRTSVSQAGAPEYWKKYEIPSHYGTETGGEITKEQYLALLAKDPSYAAFRTPASWWSAEEPEPGTNIRWT